ncbi:MAG TPA: class I SAM-dependent methyltransferase [Gaiellaceae bacterium]
MSDAELDRIRTEYRARDSASGSPYRWDNPAYVAYMQEVERALLSAFREAGVRLQGARVLDVGCGNGYFLHRLQEYGAGECHGIDLMENRIAEGGQRYPTLKLQVGSATELPYTNGEFDLVTQFTCLSSILDGDVRMAAAREMRRVAGGWILSYDLRGLSLGPLRRRGEATPVVPLDASELRRLFGEPELLRRAGVPLELAGHRLLGATAAAVPPLRSHLIGLWRQGSR